ncbi:MAG: aromatic amino acid ammonia-lyase [Bacteroidota bacterium]
MGLSGKYRVNHHDTVWEGDTWFTFHHMMPIRWQEGEALAYVNGTACMTALATLALDEGQKAWKQSLWHTFVMGEAQAAFKEAWHPLLGQAKSHPGQQLVLEQLTQWGMASQRLQDQSMGTHQNEQRLPQDPYTIRCAPQLLGAVYDQLSYVESVVTREINSASGNPTVFVDEGIIIHGGNFNGQSLAFVADTLTQNLVYMGVYAERRIARMTDPSLNLGLPAYMVREKLGLQSGLMGAQVTASALVAQLRSLATPLAIQSIPTNNSNQDIVSMGTLAAWRSTQCAGILAQILAIEAILLGEAVEIRQEQETCKAFAPITSKWRAELREKIPSLTQDRPLSDEIQMMAEIIREGKGMT